MTPSGDLSPQSCPSPVLQRAVRSWREESRHLLLEFSAAMESLMTECVQYSLRLFMNRNAIFVCERLCTEFPSEVIFLLCLRLFVSTLRKRNFFRRTSSIVVKGRLFSFSVGRDCQIWHLRGDILGLYFNLGVLQFIPFQLYISDLYSSHLDC